MCFSFGFTPHKYNLKLIFFLIQLIGNIIALSYFLLSIPCSGFSNFRLQLFDLVEHKVQGDGNCQVTLLPG
uniref:Putative ovule protein n=1 Tax=Solanum chacoense TaxID=4108 RepID=A0A0V0H2W7_SOLCH